MAFSDDLDRKLLLLARSVAESEKMMARFRAEVEFAARLAAAHPDHQVEWEQLILRAMDTAEEALAAGASAKEAVSKAEQVLAPLGAAAKQYTIHCVGHAHIDMNWMWGWPETVATVNDTFTTVDRLMDEFPEFRFSQSQASVYQIMKDYLPELYAKVKQRVKEGRWEITANHWVEGDKNLASGEILCRHLLYTKRFLAREFGPSRDAVSVDFEPDTFGHAHTLPTILRQAGVRRYYFCRGGHGPQLFWWQGPDGSRVLAFDDQVEWYNGQITPTMTRLVFEFEKATGLKDLLFLYGVGDHGGGPTRRDLQAAGEMNSWPIFPNLKLSTTDAFFTIAEQHAKGLPVVDRELNFVFEGCYTSQSNIKHANRRSENALVEAEALAVLGQALAGIPYPAEGLALAWRHAMLNQFHDILPGSGVRDTYRHAQGLYQEILAQTTMIKTRVLRTLASTVSTLSCCPPSPTETASTPPPDDIGGGAGDVGAAAAVSRRTGGALCCDPFVVFNPTPWARSELAIARIWDREWADGEIVVTDHEGAVRPAQVTGRGNYWGHRYTDLVFPAPDVPAMGYRTFAVGRSPSPPAVEAEVRGDGHGVMANEFLRVEVEPGSGAITSLVDRGRGVELVPEGQRLGLLEYFREAPHGMTAWVLGQIAEVRPFVEGAVLEFPHNGPWLAAVRARHRLNDSRLTLTISLAAGSPRLDFALEVEWLERGAPDIGVPGLRVSFPLAITDGVARYECANGHVVRPTDPKLLTSYTHKWCGGSGLAPYPEDVPAQKWVDLTGRSADGKSVPGATLLNDSKYGHSVVGSVIRTTLLRSSYDPDPLPELGHHSIRFALQPHAGTWTVSDSTRAGYGFNLPMNVVATDVHDGSPPARKGFVEVLISNAMVSALKRAEDSDALILRLYEMEGKAGEARIALDPRLLVGAGGRSAVTAVETDLLERPLAENSASIRDGVLSVQLPAFGMVTVKIG